MDRLNMAIALIKEAQEERDRLKSFERDYEEAQEKDIADTDHWSFTNRAAVEKAYSPIPHKSVVNDNLKMARRLLAAEYL